MRSGRIMKREGGRQGGREGARRAGGEREREEGMGNGERGKWMGGKGEKGK